MSEAATKRTADDVRFTKAFSTYSVNDLEKAKEFYGSTLGITVNETKEGLSFEFENSTSVFVYPKDDHQPATFTVLNFRVPDITAAVRKLANRSVEFESYDGEMKTDENGIYWGKEKDQGPNIAWFKDPAGNFLSVIEE